VRGRGLDASDFIMSSGGPCESSKTLSDPI
jgi:hypothetical protein